MRPPSLDQGPADAGLRRVTLQTARSGKVHQNQVATKEPPKMTKITRVICMNRHQPTNAIYTSAIVALLLLLLNSHGPQEGGGQVRARIIRIYHKYKDAADNLTNSIVDELQRPQAAASALSMQQSIRAHQDVDDDTSRMSSQIELSSPMKRIMDLIGHHAPVIVVDSMGGSEGDTQAPQQQEQRIMTPAQTSSAQADLSNQQLQPQPQQQHWTILETGQMLQPVQQMRQQPMAQQQQIFQTNAMPQEQYFTFTPFGLAATTNPFAPPQQQVAQQSFVTYPTQPVQPREYSPNYPSQMTQSSQNHQQQQQQQRNEVQPVFLSSYVPELPVSSGSQQALGGGGNIMPHFSMPVQSQVQQPNSIQQIQQQQQQGADGANTPPPPLDGSGDSSEPTSGGVSEGATRDEDEPPSQGGDGPPSSSSADEAEPEDAPGKRRYWNDEGGDSSPSSGSSSFEDKYDSDRDEQPSQQKTSGRVRTAAAVAGSSDGPTPNGLLGVGLNDDCLQCICRASSGCDDLLRCITLGAEEKFCGPFQLTEEYWHKASSPGDAQNNFSSFEDCANDVDCAVETVTKYMQRHYRDCDGDEQVTCMDYARLHRMQPNECHQTSKLVANHEDYWQKFQRCAETYNRTRNGDDEDI